MSVAKTNSTNPSASSPFYISKSERKRLLMLFDLVLLVVLCFTLLFSLRNGEVKYLPNLLLLNIILYYVIARLTGLFDDRYYASWKAILIRSLITFLIHFTFFYGIMGIDFDIFKIKAFGMAMAPFFAFYVISFIVKLIYRALVFMNLKKNILIVGAGKSGVLIADCLMESIRIQKDRTFNIVGFIDDNKPEDFSYRGVNLIGRTDDIDSIVEKYGVKEVVFAIQNTKGVSDELFNKLLIFIESGIEVSNTFTKYEELMQRLPIEKVGKDFYHFFPFAKTNSSIFYLSIIRIIEIVLSIVGLVIMALFVPFIFLANLIFSPGPLFYSQKRVGLYGKEFNLTKFRSMVVDAEKGGAKWASKNDDRTTKIGGLLRKTRIDELPQFFAVLRGEMGLIGPRPERRVFVDQLKKEIPFFEARHFIKPGITGWAQVMYKYGNSTNDSLIKLKYDLYYIKNRSIALDIQIIIKTIFTVLNYKGL